MGYLKKINLLLGKKERKIRWLFRLQKSSKNFRFFVI